MESINNTSTPLSPPCAPADNPADKSPTRAVTNNTAEYLVLTGALEWLQSVELKNKHRVIIHGDSQLVFRQIAGTYKAKKQHLRTLRDRVLSLLNGFDWETKWERRDANVRRFGH